MRILILTAGLLALSACISANLQQYAAVDLRDRTVTVPFGSAGLTGKLKGKLATDGWRMVVYQGPQVTKGTLGPSTNLESGDTFLSRYNLLVSWNQFDICFNLQPMIYYDIALVDNKSGTEVVTMSGRGCEDDVATQFVTTLKAQQ